MEGERELHRLSRLVGLLLLRILSYCIAAVLFWNWITKMMLEDLICVEADLMGHGGWMDVDFA